MTEQLQSRPSPFVWESDDLPHGPVKIPGYNTAVINAFAAAEKAIVVNIPKPNIDWGVVFASQLWDGTIFDSLTNTNLWTISWYDPFATAPNFRRYNSYFPSVGPIPPNFAFVQKVFAPYWELIDTDWAFLGGNLGVVMLGFSTLKFWIVYNTDIRKFQLIVFTTTTPQNVVYPNKFLTLTGFYNGGNSDAETAKIQWSTDPAETAGAGVLPVVTSQSGFGSPITNVNYFNRMTVHPDGTPSAALSFDLVAGGGSLWATPTIANVIGQIFYFYLILRGE